MKVSHNGVNAIRNGTATWDPAAGRTYRGVPVPHRLDPDDWSPSARYRIRAWCRRLDARLDDPANPASALRPGGGRRV